MADRLDALFDEPTTSKPIAPPVAPNPAKMVTVDSLFDEPAPRSKQATSVDSMFDEPAPAKQSPPPTIFGKTADQLSVVGRLSKPPPEIQSTNAAPRRDAPRISGFASMLKPQSQKDAEAAASLAENLKAKRTAAEYEKAKAFASMYDPYAAQRMDAVRAGASQDDALKIGTVNSSGRVIVGTPTAVVPITPAEDPELTFRQQSLDAKYVPEDPYKRTPFAALKTTDEQLFGKDEPKRAEEWGAGVGERNADGTVGPHYALETATMDFNPLAAVAGLGDALVRQTERSLGGTGNEPRGGLHGPMANLGRFVGDAPAALYNIVDEKVQGAQKAYDDGGIEGLGAHIIGADEAGQGVTSWGQQSNYKGDALDALFEGIANAPGEVYELGAATAQAGVGAYNAIRGALSDQPTEKTLRPIVDTATGMAAGFANDLTRLAGDPKHLLSKGILRTLMTVMPVTQATRAALGVEKMGLRAAEAMKEAERLAVEWKVGTIEDIAPDGTPAMKYTPLPELVAEEQRLAGAQRGAAQDAGKAQETAAAARFRESESAARDWSGGTDPLYNDMAKQQRIAREAESAAARDKLLAANDAKEAFDTKFKPALEAAIDEVDHAMVKAKRLATKANFVKAVADLPTGYATLGLSTIADLAGVAINRGINVPAMLAKVGVDAPAMMKNWKLPGLRDAGSGGARHALLDRSTRLPWLAPLERELGREVNSQIIRAQEAFRNVPDELKPEVSKGLHLEASLQEGGYYNPGLDRTLNVMDYTKGEGWHYTPYGEKVKSAHVEAAAKGSIESADWLQKADSHLNVMNEYGNPLADISHELTAKEIRVGIIDPFDKQAHIAQRAQNVDRAKSKFIRDSMAADTRYRSDLSTAARTVGVQSTALDKLAGTAQRAMKRGRERDVSTAVKAIDRAAIKADQTIARAVAARDAAIAKSLKESQAARGPEAQAAASKAHNSRVDAINRAYDRSTAEAIKTIARRRRDVRDVARSGGEGTGSAAARVEARIDKQGREDVAKAERARDKAISDSLDEVERAHTPEAYSAAAKAHGRNVASANKAFEDVVFREDRVLKGLDRKNTAAAFRAGKQYATDAGAVAEAQRRLLTEAVARADRIVKRAAARRDKAIADAANALDAETVRILSEPVPEGLRPVQWRQVYDKKAVRERIDERAPNTSAGEYAPTATLHPNTDLPHARANKLRQLGASMTRRAEEYGQKQVLADEVVALQERAKDASKYELFQRLANEHSLTDVQFNQKVAMERAMVQAERRRQGLPPLEGSQLATLRTAAHDAYIKVADDVKFEGMEPGLSPKKYGDLAGRYISEDLWFELRNAENVALESSNAFNKTLSMVKFGKTALSPVTTARNIVSSALLFAPMAGISLLNPKNWVYFWDALKDMTRQTKSAAYHAENAAGIGAGSLVSTEMALKVLDDMHSGFIGHATGPIRGFMQGAAELMTGTRKMLSPSEWRAIRSEKANLAKLAKADAVGGQRGWDAERFKVGADGKRVMVMPSAMKTMKQGVSKITDATRQAFLANPGAFYSSQDVLFKRALARKLIAEGMSADAAYARAAAAFVNYADIPGFVNLVRNMHAPVWSRAEGGVPMAGGLAVFLLAPSPFFTFTAKAIPMAAEWATKNPARALIYSHLYDTMSRNNLITSGLTEDSAKAAIRSGRQFEQGKRLLAEILPGVARDPVSGDLRRIDANYLSLMGDMFTRQTKPTNEVARRIATINQILQIGPNMLTGPISQVMEDYDSFRKSPVTPLAASPEAAFAAVGNYLIRSLLPPTFPSPSDLWRGSIDINDRTRIGGGGDYEKVASAAVGKRDYAGNMKTVGEALTGIFTGTKLDSVSLHDNVLNHLTSLSAVDQSAMNEAVKASGQANRLTDPNIEADAELAVGREYYTLMRPHLLEAKNLVDGLIAPGLLGRDPDIIDVSDRIQSAIEFGDDGDYKRFGEDMDSLLGDARKQVGERNRDRRNAASQK